MIQAVIVGVLWNTVVKVFMGSSLQEQLHISALFTLNHTAACVPVTLGVTKRQLLFPKFIKMLYIQRDERFLFKVCLYIFSLVQGASFPTPTGITQEMARNNCTSFISLSAAGNACQAIVEVDVQGTLESCIDDIMVSHNL